MFKIAPLGLRTKNRISISPITHSSSIIIQSIICTSMPERQYWAACVSIFMLSSVEMIRLDPRFDWRVQGLSALSSSVAWSGEFTTRPTGIMSTLSRQKSKQLVRHEGGSGRPTNRPAAIHHRACEAG